MIVIGVGVEFGVGAVAMGGVVVGPGGVRGQEGFCVRGESVAFVFGPQG